MDVAGLQNRFAIKNEFTLLYSTVGTLLHVQSEAYCFFPTPKYVVQSVNQTQLGFTVSNNSDRLCHSLIPKAYKDFS